MAIVQRPGVLHKAAKLIVIFFGLIFLSITILLIVIGTPFFAAQVAGWLSDKSGRDIGIEGKIETHLWSSTPRIVLHHVKIGNAQWAASPSMLEADRIAFSIKPLELFRGRIVLPELILDALKLALEKNTTGESNWTFSQNPKSLAVKAPLPENRYELPIIGRLSINNGLLSYRDSAHDTLTELKVSTVEGRTGKESSINLTGKGSYAKQAFELNFTGGSILQLRENDEPYHFVFKTVVGNTSADAEGQIQDPIKMEKLDVILHLKGANTAELFPLTGIALPPSPPYNIRGHLTRTADSWSFNNFMGKMGNSDLQGDAEWHPDRKQPYFKADVQSNNLDMKDLEGLIGANRKPQDPDRVIPDTPLDISRLKAMNADVTFKGQHIKAPDLLDNFQMVAELKDGVLKLKPVTFGIAGGKIEADLTINGTKTPAIVSTEVTFKKLSLAELFEPLAKKFGKENVSAGVLGGKATLKGKGTSLHAMLSNANGNVGVSMEGGNLSKLLLELVGLDLFRSAGLILSGDDNPVPIYCFVGDFDVEDGIMNTKEFLIDTEITTIRGDGNINLANENIDLGLRVYPKKATLVSAKSPLHIDGTFKHPKPHVEATAIAARGGIAAVIGALLAPPAALLAFVEPGLGEDSNCAAFIHRMKH